MITHKELSLLFLFFKNHFRLPFILASVALRVFRYYVSTSLSDKGRQHASEVRCPARRMLVNAREWRNNASEVALPTLLLVSKARLNARWQGRSLAFKTRWRMCFSGFHTSRSPSFVFMQTFFLFLLLTDKTRTAVKVIYLLIKKNFSAVHIFPCTLNGNIP